MAIKKITIRGKTFTYKNVYDVMKKGQMGYLLAIQAIKDQEAGKKTLLTVHKANNPRKFFNYDISKPFPKYAAKKFNISIPRSKKLFKGNDVELGKPNKQSKIKAIATPHGLPLTFYVKVYYTVVTSDGDEERDRFIRISNVSPSDDEAIRTIIIENLSNYVSDFGMLDINSIEWDKTSRATAKEKMAGYRPLKANNPLNLDNYFTNVEQNKVADCARSYLKKQLCKGNKSTKLSEKIINSLGTEEGITAMEIFELAKKYKITLYVCNFHGERYITHKVKKSNYKVLNFLDYNGHCYPINRKKLEKRKFTNLKTVIVKDVTDKLCEFLKQDILPVITSMQHDKIISIVHEDTKYIENDEYEECLNILKLYQLEDFIHDRIRLNNIMNILLNKFIKKDNALSYFPNCPFKVGGFMFQAKNIPDKKKISTIDMNKAHPHILRNLPGLPVVDIRTIKSFEPSGDINPNYFYVARPPESTLLLPRQNLYWGKKLLEAKEKGYEFEILQELPTEWVPNYYTTIIDSLEENLSEKLFKKVCNLGIGYFATSEKVTMKTTATIFDEEDLSTFDAERAESLLPSLPYKLKMDREEFVTSIYNKKLIAIAIKDTLRFECYNKLVELGVKPEDLIKINTDSISYVGPLPKNLSNKPGTWKKEEFKPFRFDPPEPTTEDVRLTHISNTPNCVNGYLCNQKAGKGKTYDIKNRLIPTLNDDYIILTPSHIALKEYKKDKLNCNVIQAYEWKKTIPIEQHIIIDEIGMCSRRAHDLFYIWSLLGKNLYAYGDFQQLPPIDSHNLYYNNPTYLSMLFANDIILEKNQRNNFSDEYYESIINETNIDRLKEEVKKYSTDWKTAETIICYRKKTVKYYNEKKMKHLGLKPFDIGLELLCCSNKLRNKHIYNQFTGTIEKVEGNEVTLKDYPLTFTKEEINKYFRPAYARTLYGTQGLTLNSYFYAPEDNFFLNGTTAYVIISRKKEPLNEA